MIRKIVSLRHLVRNGQVKLLLPESSYQVCRHLIKKTYCTDLNNPPEWDREIQLLTPDFDWDYMLDDKNVQEIEQNIHNRKGVGDIHKVRDLWKRVQEETNDDSKSQLQTELLEEAFKIPNRSNPNSPIGDESQARLVESVGIERDFSKIHREKNKVKTANDIAEKLRVVGDFTNLTTGERTLHFYGDLAKLEQALIKYTLSRLLDKEFTLFTVPDMLHPSIIERCGFPTTGHRTQVFKLKPDLHGDICFAGTAEMPLAGYFMNEVIPYDELPTRVCAVSRCYRAETSEAQREKGLYRTRIFTKVEMFGVTANDTGNEGDELLEEFLQIQKDLFKDLNIKFRTLDMPTQELGAPAYRKFDIEAYMEAGKWWGEISSASNCTDYQSRRLNIKYRNKDGHLKHASTVNATACAVPRLVMAMFERFQWIRSGHVRIPPALLPYMDMPDEQEDIVAVEKTYDFIKKSKLS